MQQLFSSSLTDDERQKIIVKSSSLLSKMGDVLSVVLLGVFVMLLIAGIGLPLYSDEVVTKWGHARFFEPGGVSSSFFPQCREAFGSQLPKVFYPGAVLLFIAYGALPPLGLRLAGSVVALGVIVCFGFWGWRSTQSVRSTVRLLAVMVGMLALGVLPFLWSLARPEQILTLGLIFFCMTVVVCHKNDEKYSWVWPILYVPVVSAFFFVHPKSIFFAPVVVLAAWLISVRRPVARIILIAWILWASYAVYRWGVMTSNCPEAPAVQAALSSNFMSPSLLLQSPTAFISQGLNNLLSAPAKIAGHALFAMSFQSGWLPPMSVPGLAAWVNPISRALIMFTLFGALVYGLLRLPLTWLHRQAVTPQVLLSGALALGLCVNFFFYQHWFFYGVTQALPIVLMLVLLALPGRIPAWLSLSVMQVVRSVYLLFVLTSMAICAKYSVPEVWKRSNPPIASVADQWLSVPALGFGHRRETIRELSEQCGIQGDGAKHLVVDHLTYYAFKHLQKPVHVLYISELAYGGDLLGQKLIHFLQGLETPGVIAQCNYIPAALSLLPSYRKDGLCCIPVLKERK